MHSTHDSAIAFAGLYKTRDFADQQIHSCTIITHEGHPELAHIHKKSLPLMIQPGDYDTWLNCKFEDTSEFERLVTPKLGLVQLHCYHGNSCECFFGMKSLFVVLPVSGIFPICLSIAD